MKILLSQLIKCGYGKYNKEEVVLYSTTPTPIEYSIPLELR
jgi:hypothetical protein